MLRRSILALLFVLLGNPINAQEQPGRAATRGELLYATHCVACHNMQMHWRDRQLATDWSSLHAQVRRWQDVARLGWSNDDITEVARYLNARIYRFPAVQPG